MLNNTEAENQFSSERKKRALATVTTYPAALRKIVAAGASSIPGAVQVWPFGWVQNLFFHEKGALTQAPLFLTQAQGVGLGIGAETQRPDQSARELGVGLHAFGKLLLRGGRDLHTQRSHRFSDIGLRQCCTQQVRGPVTHGG